MKWLLGGVGIILALLGMLWILQGTGLVPIGFMARHLQYAVLGLAAVVVGLALVLFAVGPRKVPPRQSELKPPIER